MFTLARKRISRTCTARWGGLRGGEGTVQPRCRSASLPRSLGRSLICPPGPAGRLTLAGQPYQIRLLRIWRILGGGKMRQNTLASSTSQKSFYK